MVNSIIDGISIKLGEVFEDIDIYSESVKQGFKEPCFFIKTVSTSEDKMLASRYFRNNSFDIHYFPSKNSEINKEMLNIAEDLYLNMEFISLVNGDELYGHKLKHKIIDDVLHFQINYDMFIKKPSTKLDNMENINLSQNTKG